jgi:hypothetical protein
MVEGLALSLVKPSQLSLLKLLVDSILLLYGKLLPRALKEAVDAVGGSLLRGIGRCRV